MYDTVSYTKKDGDALTEFCKLATDFQKEMIDDIATKKNTSTPEISKLTVSKLKSMVYTGKALKPSVTIKDGTKTLIKGTDYTVSYKNNIKVGNATIIITGKENYTGTVKVKFKIVAKKK